MTTADDEFRRRIKNLETVTASLSGHAEAAPPAAAADEVTTGQEVVPEAAGPIPGPWLWKALDGEDQVALWEELRGFVAYLSRRYLADVSSEYRLPMCWYRHPAAVELLTALMVAHLATYFDNAEPSQELMQFQETWLWRTVERWQRLKIFSSCGEGHQARRIYGQLAGTDIEDFDQFVQEATAPAESDQ